MEQKNAHTQARARMHTHTHTHTHTLDGDNTQLLSAGNGHSAASALHNCIVHMRACNYLLKTVWLLLMPLHSTERKKHDED